MTTENPGSSGPTDPWQRPEGDVPGPVTGPPGADPAVPTASLPPAGSWSSGYPAPGTPGYGQPATWPPAGQQWPPSNPYATGPAQPNAGPGYPQQPPSAVGGPFYAGGQQGYGPGPYAGQQPGYAGQQPGFAPQQPGYATRQPGYAPQQPGYATRQPGYAPQQPGYPGGTDPYQPTVAPTPPPQKRRGGLFILLGVLAVCLVMVVVGVLNRPRTTTSSTTGTTTAPGASSAPTAVAASASDAVKGYLAALAAGDAAAALSYAELPPGDDTLLTNDVLAASNLIGPISDIEVTPSSGSGAASVEASYSIAGQNIDTTYDVVETSAGWKLAQGAAEIDADRLGGFPVQLNGVAVTAGDTFVLFPGSYHLASGDARYRISGGDFVVASPADLPDVETTITLTDSGRAAVRAAARKKLTACIKANKAMPADSCGFGVDLVERTTGKKITAKSVRWRIASGKSALASLKVTVDSSNPTVATGQTTVKLRVDIVAKNGHRYWGTSVISSVRANLADGQVSVAFNQ